MAANLVVLEQKPTQLDLVAAAVNLALCTSGMQAFSVATSAVMRRLSFAAVMCWLYFSNVSCAVTCRLYPYYVTRDMISDWGTHTSQGQTVNWDAARSMQLNNPEIRQSRHDWGSQGATIDFGGGGGNYGGGGTGGSW